MYLVSPLVKNSLVLHFSEKKKTSALSIAYEVNLTQVWKKCFLKLLNQVSIWILTSIKLNKLKNLNLLYTLKCNDSSYVVK